MRSRVPVDVEHLDLELLADLRPSRDGCEMRPHDMSVMWSRPSTPPRSMKAPKSVMFLTTPFRTWSFWSSFISFSRLPARSVSRITRRETTMLRRRLLSLMILNSYFWPSSSSMLGTRRSAICEPGQERVDAHQVDHHAALDLLDQGAFDRLVGLVRHADPLPHAHEVGLLLRQDDRAFLVFEVLEQDLDLVAGLEVRVVLELLERDGAFGLEADVEHHEVVADLEHRGLHDLPFLDRGQGAVVQLHHPLVIGGRNIRLRRTAQGGGWQAGAVAPSGRRAFRAAWPRCRLWCWCRARS